MTIFSRYYDDQGNLQETTMDNLELLLDNEINKQKVAQLVYNRYYERYLKIFFYQNSESKMYVNSGGIKKVCSVFNMEFKNGFTIMVNCCLLIEILASFLNGINTTPNGKGDESYNLVFKKAVSYKNDLAQFKDKPIYRNVRNGLLHQGETYKDFKIRREGNLFKDNTINATKFCNSLNQFLESYRDELSNSETKWDSDLWHKCRIKLRCIIGNTYKL